MTVTLKEYEDAKSEIIRGVEYKEHSNIEPDGRIAKQYITEKNGAFYEVTDKGITEFWSDKHPESRYYDGRTREELLADWKDMKNLCAKFIAEISRLVGETIVLEAKNKELASKNKTLEGKLAAVNAITAGAAA